MGFSTPGSFRRSWLWLSLPLLSIVPIAALMFGHSLFVRDARSERDAISAITAAGGKVYYAWQRPDVLAISTYQRPKRLGSLLAQLGPDYFGPAKVVIFDNASPQLPDDAVLAHLGCLRGLEKVDFSPPQKQLVTSGNISHPAVTDAGLSQLKGLAKLQRLNLSFTGVRGPGLTQLLGLKQLRELDLEGLPFSDDDLVRLEGFKSLTRLCLRSDRITDAGAGHLSGLTELRWLTLSSKSITSVGLRHLRGMVRLEYLGLESTKIDDLSSIQHLTELTGVSLSYSGVRDDDLAALARLPRLKHLFLGNTPVGDAGLKRLAGTIELRFVDVVGTRVTEAGLASFARTARCTVLVGGTQVTASGVGRLRESHPGMEIISVGSSSIPGDPGGRP
jgi:hypothetical protein